MPSHIFIAYLSLSLLCALINIAPAVSHFAQGHSGPASFGIWVVVLNLLGFINGIIWMSDAQDRAPIFCDVSAKLTMVGPLGLLIANCCIIRYLARILAPNTMIEHHSKARLRIITDYAMSFGIPTLIAILSVMFQVARYEVQILVGCSSVSVLAWPTMFIFIIWPPIMCGIACGYAIYVLYWLVRQRKELTRLMMKSRTPLNLSRFIRMCALAATYLCISAPYTIAGTVTILDDIGPFVTWRSWGYIHNDDNKLSDVRKNPSYQLNIRDWLAITAGLTVFFFFSFAKESIAIYTRLVHTLALNNLSEALPYWMRTRSQTSLSPSSPINKPKRFAKCSTAEKYHITPVRCSPFSEYLNDRSDQSIGYLNYIAGSDTLPISVLKHSGPKSLVV